MPTRTELQRQQQELLEKQICEQDRQQAIQKQLNNLDLEFLYAMHGAAPRQARRFSNKTKAFQTIMFSRLFGGNNNNNAQQRSNHSSDNNNNSKKNDNNKDEMTLIGFCKKYNIKKRKEAVSMTGAPTYPSQSEMINGLFWINKFLQVQHSIFLKKKKINLVAKVLRPSLAAYVLRRRARIERLVKKWTNADRSQKEKETQRRLHAAESDKHLVHHGSSTGAGSASSSISPSSSPLHVPGGGGGRYSPTTSNHGSSTTSASPLLLRNQQHQSFASSSGSVIAGGMIDASSSSSSSSSATAAASSSFRHPPSHPPHHHHHRAAPATPQTPSSSSGGGGGGLLRRAGSSLSQHSTHSGGQHNQHGQHQPYASFRGTTPSTSAPPTAGGGGGLSGGLEDEEVLVHSIRNSKVILPEERRKAVIVWMCESVHAQALARRRWREKFSAQIRLAREFCAYQHFSSLMVFWFVLKAIGIPVIPDICRVPFDVRRLRELHGELLVKQEEEADKKVKLAEVNAMDQKMNDLKSQLHELRGSSSNVQALHHQLEQERLKLKAEEDKREKERRKRRKRDEKELMESRGGKQLQQEQEGEDEPKDGKKENAGGKRKATLKFSDQQQLLKKNEKKKDGSSSSSEDDDDEEDEEAQHHRKFLEAMNSSFAASTTHMAASKEQLASIFDLTQQKQHGEEGETSKKKRREEQEQKEEEEEEEEEEEKRKKQGNNQNYYHHHQALPISETARFMKNESHIYAKDRRLVPAEDLQHYLRKYRASKAPKTGKEINVLFDFSAVRSISTRTKVNAMEDESGRETVVSLSSKETAAMLLQKQEAEKEQRRSHHNYNNSGNNNDNNSARNIKNQQQKQNSNYSSSTTGLYSSSSMGAGGGLGTARTIQPATGKNRASISLAARGGVGRAGEAARDKSASEFLLRSCAAGSPVRHGFFNFDTKLSVEDAKSMIAYDKQENQELVAQEELEREKIRRRRTANLVSSSSSSSSSSASTVTSAPVSHLPKTQWLPDIPDPLKNKGKRVF